MLKRLVTIISEMGSRTGLGGVRQTGSRPLISNREALLIALPAAVLSANWLFGEPGLVAAAVGIPLLGLLLSRRAERDTAGGHRDNNTGLMLRDSLLSDIDTYIADGREKGLQTAGLVLELEDFAGLKERWNDKTLHAVLRQLVSRLQSVLRASDSLASLGAGRFGLALSPVRRIDLESMIQLASRLHDAVEEPFIINGETIHLSACSGFCLLSRSPGAEAKILIEAAENALSVARRNGSGAIRAYTREMRASAISAHELRTSVERALSNGEIRPWYQPQVSTDTGKVTGAEALARWVHPDKGIISPAEFLPVIEAAGLSGRLGEVILYHALTALKSLDQAGTKIPVMGVNFSATELRDPKLVDRIRWELDRFDLEPARLGVEVLENVVADSDDDIVSRNIKALAELGCSIDLDDFGTGHASISSIRRFEVGRLKIDRSFVSKIDEDQAQQRMLSAILTMAEQLNLETLAEGVETPGEHAMLAQLGCGHVQGFGIGRPMAVEDLPAWLEQHENKRHAALHIGRKLG